tara:strand:+ start:52 stop:366 length:315 start_codon:yes stop_codon:yes gene_type:complete
MLIVLDKELTLEQVSNNPTKATCLYFTASWCGPCKMIFPKVEELAKNENIVFVKIDVDEYGELSEECDVKSMPTFIFFKEGKETDRMTGADGKGLEMKTSLALL